MQAVVKCSLRTAKLILKALITNGTNVSTIANIWHWQGKKLIRNTNLTKKHQVTTVSSSTVLSIEKKVFPASTEKKNIAHISSCFLHCRLFYQSRRKKSFADKLFFSRCPFSGTDGEARHVVTIKALGGYKQMGKLKETRE